MEDEKRIIEARHKKDMEAMQQQKENQMFGMAVEGNEFRNRNEKL